jgi:organic hydroperoxide reductase OsmC/OhrA
VFLERVDEGFKITAITLETEAKLPGIDEKTLVDTAEADRHGCPISQAMASLEINLSVKLLR